MSTLKFIIIFIIWVILVAINPMDALITTGSLIVSGVIKHYLLGDLT